MCIICAYSQVGVSLVYFYFAFKIGSLRQVYGVGTEVANSKSEGSFLIPGGRQRQTLSPLLNPAGQPGLFLSKNLLTPENTERAEATE